MGSPRKYREVVKILREHDSRYEFWDNRGKGSHRTIYHPDIDGRSVSVTVKCHGEGTELRKGTISDLRRKFKLPKNLL
jgi:predicted RNA binding protein YcfA (HicA-like mRNA interferase family)